MRRKMGPNEKRSQHIGIKVQIKTRKQLEYISERDKTPLSTLINEILIKHIEEYFKIAKIDWEKLSPEERGENPK